MRFWLQLLEQQTIAYYRVPVQGQGKSRYTVELISMTSQLQQQPIATQLVMLLLQLSWLPVLACAVHAKSLHAY